MVNTILSGFLTLGMKVLDFFLSPIENAITHSGLNTGFNTFVSNFNSLMNVLKGVLPWVIDATGLPKALFKLIFTAFIGGVGVRVGMLVTKLVLKWWDRIVA